MIASWMLYSAAISFLLSFAALSLDHALRRRGLALRWVWVAAIGGSVALSAYPWMQWGAARGAPPPIDDVAVAVAADPMMRGAPAETASGPALTEPTDGGALPWAAISSLPSLDRYLLPGWAFASMGAVLLLIGAHRRLDMRRRRWRPEVLDGLPVLVSNDVGPAVVGFVDTAIVVPEWVLALDPKRRRLVLIHETEHLRAGDPTLLLLAFVLIVVMPWNAPLWWQLRRLRHAVELDCDARVLHLTRDAATYGELLIDVGEKSSIRRLGLAAFAESSSFLAARIRNLTAPPPRVWRMLAGSFVSVFVLVLAVACEAPTPAALDPESAAGSAAVANGGRPERADASPVDGDEESADSVAQETEGEVDTARLAEKGVEAAAALQPATEPSAAAEAGAETEVELVTRSQPNIANMRELIRLLHPDVYRDGIPLDRALWFAIDLEGRIRESWVGPNLYVNFAGGVEPQTWLALPEGTIEERRAKAEHQRAVQQVLDANVPGMRIRARYAAHSYRPVPITLHLLTERPGTPAWGGRDTLATDIVIRTRLAISGERLSLPPAETISWRGERWTSMIPARIIDVTLLERVGEIAGTQIFAEAERQDADVIYRLEREPNVFLPFRRQP